MRARKSPPPACWAAATAAAGKDLKPFGGGGSSGARFLFSRIYLPAPIRFSGGILCGVAAAPPVPAPSGRGAAPQAPGRPSGPEGRARAWGVSAQTL